MRIIISLLFLLCLLVGCGQEKVQTGNLSIEQQLVILDNAGPLPKPDEVIVRGYKSILDDLVAKYPGQSLHDIADQSVRGQGALATSGIKVSIYEIISGMDEATEKVIVGLSYKDAVATYATLRVKGIPHDEAVKGLKAYLLPPQSIKG